MRSFLRRGGRRYLVLASGVVALAGVGVGVAFGTPAIGSAEQTTLANVNVVNTVDMDVNGIRFRTESAVEIVHLSNVAAPGWSSGWHQHNGPILITVTSGKLTFYDQPGPHGHQCRV